MTTATEARAKHLTLGVAGAAVLILIGGQFWPGYQLDTTANDAIKKAETRGGTVALATVCAAQFKALPDAEIRLATLGEVRTSTMPAARAVITESGAALLPGTETPSSAVVNACTDMLHEMVKSAAQ